MKKSKSLIFLLFLSVFSLISCEEEEDDTSWDCANGTCVEVFSSFGLFSSRSNCESECGGSNNTLGKVSFYTQSDLGCGNITVFLQGVGSDVITGFYPNGFSGCDQNANANFNVPKGSYTYTAECDGYTWPERTITVGNCTGVQLTN